MKGTYIGPRNPHIAGQEGISILCTCTYLEVRLLIVMLESSSKELVYSRDKVSFPLHSHVVFTKHPPHFSPHMHTNTAALHGPLGWPHSQEVGGRLSESPGKTGQRHVA